MVTRMGLRLVCRRRWLLAFVVLLLVGAGRTNAQGCTGVSPSTTGDVTWTPQWCQEFNANTVSAPDTTAWKFDLGNNGGWGNNEIEVYCGPPGYAGSDSKCPNTLSSSTNTVYQDGNGHLVIQPINVSGTWISTRMLTAGVKTFQFGRIEASLQLPDTTNPGLWPAFWSLGNSITTGTPWPNCGEVDFMENWSPQVFNGPGPSGNKATLHTAVTGGSGTGGSFTFPNGQQANTAFHTYGVIWSANMMQFYIDDATQPFLIKTPGDLSATDTWPFNLPIFLLMNVAVGGTLGGSTATLANPQPLMADYVRWYTAINVPKPSLGAPPPISVKAGAATGNTSTFTPSLTPGTGFVYFSCSTNAPKASCAISTSDHLNGHVVNSNSAESVTATMTTTSNAIAPPFFFRPRVRLWPVTVFLLLVVVALGLFKRNNGLRYGFGFATLVVLILAGTAMVGCGGGYSTTPPPANNGTPPGSYSITVYAFTQANTTDGSNANADVSVAIPVTVN